MFDCHYQLHFVFTICIIVIIHGATIDREVILKVPNQPPIYEYSSINYTDPSNLSFFVREHVQIKNETRHIYMSPLSFLEVNQITMIPNSITNRTTMIIPLILYTNKQIQSIRKINMNKCTQGKTKCSFYKVPTETMRIIYKKTYNQTILPDFYRQYINSLWVTYDPLLSQRLYINIDCLSNETCLKLNVILYQLKKSTGLHLQYADKEAEQHQIIINDQHLLKIKSYSLKFILERDVEQFLDELLYAANINDNEKYLLSHIDLFLLKQTLRKQLLGKSLILTPDNNEKQWNFVYWTNNNDTIASDQIEQQRKVNFKYFWKKTMKNNTNINDDINNYIYNTHKISTSSKLKSILAYELNQFNQSKFFVRQLIHMTKVEDIYSIPIRSFVPFNKDLHHHIPDDHNADIDPPPKIDMTEQTDSTANPTIYESTSITDSFATLIPATEITTDHEETSSVQTTTEITDEEISPVQTTTEITDEETSSVQTTTTEITNVEWSEKAPCPEGKYLYKGQCILCTPGSYCPNGENRIRCRRGQVAPGYGFVSCKECSTGWYSTCDAQERCLMCPKGFFCPKTDQEPQPCPIGYSSTYGAAQCKPCPSGYYTTYTNSSYCLQCPIGYSCSDPTQCPQPCPAGTYQPNIMSTSCMRCPSGHQCGTTTNLFLCTTTSCIQAERSKCNSNQRSPLPSVCTNIG